MTNFDKIPVELRKLPQWVVWRLENRADKNTKIPYLPGVDAPIQVTNWLHRTTFDKAVAAHRSGDYSGIGFVLTELDPYCIIDLDSPKSDANAIRHKQISDDFETYQELSPSGNGLHIICRGQIPRGRRSAKLDLEVYSADRYMTFTGDVIRDCKIKDQQDKISQLYSMFESKNDFGPVVVSEHSKPITRTDQEIINLAWNAKNGEKFQRLWRGEFPIGAESEADNALMNMLVFYSRNAEQSLRLFYQSTLGQRPKVHNRHDYIHNPNYGLLARGFDRIAIEDREQIRIAGIFDKEIEEFHKKKNKETEEVESVVVEQEINPLSDPENLWSESSIPRPPGMMGLIADHALYGAYCPLPEAGVVAAIGFLSAFAGRAYNFRGQALNHYCCLVAPSGTGKDRVQETITELFAHMMLKSSDAEEYRLPNEYTSSAAIRKTFESSQRNCGMSTLNEFGELLQRMTSRNDTHARGIRNTFLELYTLGKHGAVWGSSQYSEQAKSIKSIKSPAFSFVADSQPVVFNNFLDYTSIQGGFIPRLLCLYGSSIPQTRHHAHNHMISMDLSNRIDTLFHYCKTHNQSKDQLTPCQIDIDEEVDLLHRNLDQDIKFRRRQEFTENKESISSVLRTRVPGKIAKLAALVAVGINPREPVITRECYDWAKFVVEYDVSRIMQQINSGDIILDENLYETQKKCIVEGIKKWLTGKLNKTEKNRLKNTKELQQNFIVPHQYLSRYKAGYAAYRKERNPAQAFSAVMRGLQDDGLLVPIISNEALGIPNTGKFYKVSPSINLE